MADKIVSWGGIDSKGTTGMGLTGSLSISSGSVAMSGPNSMSFNYTADDTSPTFIKMTNSGNGVNTGGTIAFPYGSIIGNYGGITLVNSGGSSYNLKLGISGDLTWTGANLNFQTSGNSSIGSSGISGTSMTFRSGGSFVFNSFLGSARDIIKFSQAGNLQVGGFTDAARVEIKGSGTTSSTTALLVQNANASASLQVKDDGSTTVANGLTITSGSATVNAGSSNNFFVADTGAGTYGGLSLKNSIQDYNGLIYTGRSGAGNLILFQHTTYSGTPNAAGSQAFGATSTRFGVANNGTYGHTVTINKPEGTGGGQNYPLVLTNFKNTTNTSVGILLQTGTPNETSLVNGGSIIMFKNNLTEPYVTTNLRFYTISDGANTLSESMRISDSGNLLVGTTADLGYKVNVSGSSNLTGNMVVTGSVNTSGSLFRVNAATASFIGSSSIGPYFSITPTIAGTGPAYQNLIAAQINPSFTQSATFGVYTTALQTTQGDIELQGGGAVAVAGTAGSGVDATVPFLIQGVRDAGYNYNIFLSAKSGSVAMGMAVNGGGGAGNNGLLNPSYGNPRNVLIGAGAGQTGNFIDNVVIGYKAFIPGNISNTSNVIIGSQAVGNGATGAVSNNVILGYQAFYTPGRGGSGRANTVAIGYQANYSGSDSGVYIGYQAGLNEISSGKLYIANTSTSTPLIGGDFTNARLGVNISPSSTSATLHVKGSGTTSSTTALLVQNSAATASLTVKDDLSITAAGTITLQQPGSSNYITINPTGSNFLRYYQAGGFEGNLMTFNASIITFPNSVSFTSGLASSGIITTNNLGVDNSNTNRYIRFWRSGVASRATITHTDAGTLQFRMFDSYDDTTGGIGMYITQQGNAGITGSLSVGSLANLAEDQRMSIANPSTYYGDMFGLTLPYSFDPGVMYQVAQGGTNWNGQIASGSNIITSYPAGGNYNANYASYISVGDYVRDYNTNFRARVIAVSATTMSLDRNIAVSYTGSNFSYWPRVYGHTAGTLVYNTTTNKVNYWTTSSLNVLLDSSGSQSLTGSLIITGSSNSVLLEIDSPAVNNILYVSGSGNIGIGVSNPLNSLQVKDSISIGSTGNAGALYLRRSSDGAPLGQFYNSGNYTILKESQGAGGILETGYGTYALKWTGIGGSPSVGIGFDGTVSATTHIKGAGTTSSTTALLVQNANASASFSVRDDQSIIINGSSSMTIPNSGSALTLTRTGNYSNVGTKPILNILDDTGGANVAKGGIYVSITGASNNKAIEAYGGVGFGITPSDNQFQVAYPTQINNTVTAVSSNNNYVLTLKSLTSFATNAGTGISFWGDDRGQGTAVSAFAGIRGVKENSSYLNSLGNLVFYVQTGSAGGLTETTYREAARFNSSGSFGIGTSTPSALLHISGASSNVLLDIDSPSVNNILYVSGSGNVGIGTGTPNYKLDVAGTINSGTGYGNFTTYSPDGQFGAAYVGEEVKAAIVTARSNPATYAGVTVPGFSSALVLGTSYGYNVGTGNYILSVGDLSVRVNNTTQALYANTSGQIGIKYSGSLSANLQVRGSGTTTSTTTFLLQNSNGTQLGYVDDSGRWQIGQGTNSGVALEVSGSAQITGNSGGYKLTLKTTGGGNGAGLLVDQNGYTMFDVGANDVYMRNFPSNTAKLDFWCWNNYGGPTNVLFAQNSQYHVSLNSPDNYKIPIVKFPDATVPIIMGNIATSAIRGYLTVGGTFYASASLGASQRIVSTVSAVANNDTLIGLDILPTFSTGSYTGVTSLALRVSGSATISNVLTLTPQSPLPSGVPTGSFAVSSSAPPKPYFYDGTTWNALY